MIKQTQRLRKTKLLYIQSVKRFVKSSCMNLNEQSSKSNQSCRHKKPKKRSGASGEGGIWRGVVFGGEGNWVNGIHAEYYRVVGGVRPPPHPTHEPESHNMFSDVSAAHRP